MVLVSGFGGAGLPQMLLLALLAQGARELILVSNNAGNAGNGIAQLVAAGRVRKMICSFPRQPESGAFDDLYREGRIELELVPQGTLAERIRAGGAGIGGFFTPTGYGTDLAQGKETREINGRMYVLEYPIHADLALVRAELSAGRGPAGAAQRIAAAAHIRGADPRADTPFSRGAMAARVPFRGGKMDDCTVVISIVQEQTAALETAA